MKLIAAAILAGLALIAASIAVTNRLDVQALPDDSGWEWLVTDQWTGEIYVCRTPKVFSNESCQRLDHVGATVR